MIQEASQRLETLVERVLELSNLESGTMQIDKGAVDILTVIREAIARVQQQVPDVLRERLTFHLHARDESKKPLQAVPLVSGHYRSLSIILEHLLENAVRFSPDGGRIDVILQPARPGRIPLSPVSALPATSFLEICVCDYGIGIPDEHLERIFERFYQVDTSLTRKVNGLGIRAGYLPCPGGPPRGAALG